MPISDRAAIIAGLNDGLRFDPNLQTVTVRRVEAITPGDLVSSPNVKAVWRHRRRDYGIERIRWRLQALNSAGGVVTDAISFRPHQRDQVVEADGTVWSILSCDVIGMGARFVVEAVRLVPADFGQAGTLLRAANTAAGDGKRTPGYAVVAAAVPCRLQPYAGQQDTAFDALTTRNRYTATLGVQVAPQADDVFQVGDAKYAVKGWGDAEQLDRLPYLDLEDLP